MDIFSVSGSYNRDGENLWFDGLVAVEDGEITGHFDYQDGKVLNGEKYEEYDVCEGVAVGELDETGSVPTLRMSIYDSQDAIDNLEREPEERVQPEAVHLIAKHKEESYGGTWDSQIDVLERKTEQPDREPNIGLNLSEVESVERKPPLDDINQVLDGVPDLTWPGKESGN